MTKYRKKVLLSVLATMHLNDVGDGGFVVVVAVVVMSTESLLKKL